MAEELQHVPGTSVAVELAADEMLGYTLNPSTNDLDDSDLLDEELEDLDDDDEAALFVAE